MVTGKNGITIKLGDKVRDAFTGYEGYAHAIAHYITGCDRVLIDQRKLDEKGKPCDGVWFDAPFVNLLSQEPAVERPDKGGPPPKGERSLKDMVRYEQFD